uniref:Helix-turn-helix domain-containing protein n=1 Tax=Bradyrhizobium quebecense TaxID=2748629 RepID=A0A973WTK2_9BRAD
MRRPPTHPHPKAVSFPKADGFLLAEARSRSSPRGISRRASHDNASQPGLCWIKLVHPATAYLRLVNEEAILLVRVNAPSRRSVDGHLTVLAGERVFSSQFKYPRGAEVFGEREDAEYVYQIISGAVRTYKLLPDGRRQINSFHLAGDMFGLENGTIHRFTAEAIVETNVRIMRRRSLIDAMTNEGGGATKLLILFTRNLQHAENHMLLLGRKNALEKVAAFLLEMHERLAHPKELTLPMSRRDIADYLGLTLETVSRALSTMRDRKMLCFNGVTNRKIVLLDREGLAEIDT